MLKTLFAFIIIIFCGSNSFSQLIVNDGENAFDLSFQIGSYEASTVVGISPSYIISGRTEFGLTIGYEDINGYDISSTAIRPFVSYIALRQTDEMPINFGLSAAYQYNTFDGVDGLTFNTFSFSGSVSHITQVSKAIKLIPGLGISWDKTSVSLKGYEELSASGIAYTLYATALLQRFHLTPYLRFADGNSSFRLSFGILFPQN